MSDSKVLPLTFTAAEMLVVACEPKTPSGPRSYATHANAVKAIGEVIELLDGKRWGKFFVTIVATEDNRFRPLVMLTQEQMPLLTWFAGRGMMIARV